MPQNDSANLILNAESVDQYRALRATALRHISRYDLSESSYRALFDLGLLPLENFMRRVAEEINQPFTHDIEIAFAAAAKIQTEQHPSITDLLTLAGYRHDMLKTDIWAALEKGGAQIQPVAGCLVLSEPKEKPITTGDGDSTFKIEFAPKTHELVLALLTMGIFADDMFIYRGTVLPGMMREAPYALFDIPRLGKQIAICDQIGHTCFVSQTQKPISFWAASTKDALKADTDITHIDYDRAGKWLSKIRDLLLGTDITNLSANRFPKTTLPRASKKPLLTEETLKRWIRVTHEKTGKWLTYDYQNIWDKDEQGHPFIVEGESGRALDKTLRRGGRGLTHLRGQNITITKFREQYNFGVSRQSESRQLTEEIVKRRLRVTHEQTNKWLTEDDQNVWDEDEQGHRFIVEGESGLTLDMALRNGGRGLTHLKNKKMTLYKFRIKNGLGGEMRGGYKNVLRGKTKSSPSTAEPA